MRQEHSPALDAHSDVFATSVTVISHLRLASTQLTSVELNLITTTIYCTQLGL